jgi:glucosamine--fructose-6-phosphate aminotransferase (isomerizing)
VGSLGALQGQADALAAAGSWLRGCPCIDIVGIGSSYNAAFALEDYLNRQGGLARVIDASELAHAPSLHPAVGRIIVSRSGGSIEIVQVAERCHAEGLPFVAITNAPASPLAHLATYPITLDAPFDHLISLGMYTALVQALLLLGRAICLPGAPFPLGPITEAWAATTARLDAWRTELENSDFFGRDNSAFYLLGRGGGLAAAHEGRLLLEECGKCPATVMTTGAFRHGPQEVLSPDFHALLWVPEDPRLRELDLALAGSIRAFGGRCLLIGRDLPSSRAGETGAPADLAMDLPAAAAAWRPLVEVLPLQLGAYVHAVRRGKNPDELAYCPYIVTQEGAL